MIYLLKLIRALVVAAFTGWLVGVKEITLYLQLFLQYNLLPWDYLMSVLRPANI